MRDTIVITEDMESDLEDARQAIGAALGSVYEAIRAMERVRDDYTNGELPLDTSALGTLDCILCDMQNSVTNVLDSSEIGDNCRRCGEINADSQLTKYNGNDWAYQGKKLCEVCYAVVSDDARDGEEGEDE